VAGVVDRLKETANPSKLRASTREVDSLYENIQGLLPKDDRQRSIQTRALSILISLQETRWLMYEQESTSLSMPMLIILLSWLTTLFISFGLFAPANGTAVTALLVSALSVSGAVLLILELYSPYEGLIRISSAPLRAALTQLGN
jgi:membrane-bound ClpP family serine protease